MNLHLKKQQEEKEKKLIEEKEIKILYRQL